MKSRITAGEEPVVLLYHIASDKLQKLTALLEGLGVNSRVVGEKQTAQTLEELAGYRPVRFPAADVKDAPLTHEFLAMCALDQKTMNRLLSLMKARECTVSRKAVMTPHNRHWRFCDLLTEIEKEHQLMQNMPKTADAHPPRG